MQRQAIHRSVTMAWRDSRGVAAIELALIAPILALLLICTADLGLGIYRKMQVQNAAQAGAQLAALKGFDANAISNAVASATSLAVAASPAPSQFCGCATTTAVNTAVCNTPCAGGGIAGNYVKVSAQSNYTTLLIYPLLPRSFTFTVQSTVKIQ
jgi:Flp pilus assembly protein TadG